MNYEKRRYQKDAIACNQYSTSDKAMKKTNKKRTNGNAMRKKNKKAMKQKQKQAIAIKSSDLRNNPCIEIVKNGAGAEYICILCDVHCNSVHNIKQHLNGNKHRKQNKIVTEQLLRNKTTESYLPKSQTNFLSLDNNHNTLHNNMKMKMNSGNTKFNITHSINQCINNNNKLSMPDLESGSDMDISDDDMPICVASEINTDSNVKFCPNCNVEANRTQHDTNNGIEWTYWCWDCGDV
eukprot:544318_1